MMGKRFYFESMGKNSFSYWFFFWLSCIRCVGWNTRFQIESENKNQNVHCTFIYLSSVIKMKLFRLKFRYGRLLSKFCLYLPFILNLFSVSKFPSLFSHSVALVFSSSLSVERNFFSFSPQRLLSIRCHVAVFWPLRTIDSSSHKRSNDVFFRVYCIYRSI